MRFFCINPLCRPRPPESNDRSPGPVVYLMIGALKDVSPRSFFCSQVIKDLRIKWDASLKDMYSVEKNADIPHLSDGGEDRIYYRTKWPWPLKDRDYALVRR